MNRFLLFIFFVQFGMYQSQTNQNEFTTTVTFPSGYSIGQYFEFAEAGPISAGASGYYEISITYTRGNIAAAATFITSISHYNPDIWKEAGMVNANDYTIPGRRNFTIDVNGGLKKFRIRAIDTIGLSSQNLIVNIRIRSVNFNSSFTSLSASGTDAAVTKLQPMTSEWNLFVGNAFSQDSAIIGLKVINNGNVGIGVNNPINKLDVNGTIHAKEVKVDMQNWPDYVFKNEYKLNSLEETEKHIKEKGHLPNIPSAEEVIKGGINLGEMNRMLLEKIEELTLYSIEQNKQIKDLQKQNKALQLQAEKIEKLEKQLELLRSEKK